MSTPICIPVWANYAPSLAGRFARAAEVADIVEVRWDLCHGLTPENLKQVIQGVAKGYKWILKLAPQTPKEELEQLLAAQPEVIDVDITVFDKWSGGLQRYRQQGGKTLCSQHLFEGVATEQGIEAGLQQALDRLLQVRSDYHKLAVQVASTHDALVLFRLCRQKPGIIAIAMGTDGTPIRALAPLVGTPWSYAYQEQVPTGDEELVAFGHKVGQFSLEDLRDIYRHGDLNSQTKIFAVIGDPVRLSPGPCFHNGLMRKSGYNGVYIYLRVPSGGLSAFLDEAKKLPFGGLSVTMPLKEELVAHVDGIDPRSEGIGALNTVSFRNGKLIGANTDGLGALDAVEAQMPVQGRRLVILGAGGTAHAIAFEAVRRGAEVTVLNRNVTRAEALANSMAKWGLTCEWGSLGELQDLRYDVLIHTTSVGMGNSEDCLVTPEQIQPGCLVLDVISRPTETALLRYAKDRGCQTIEGIQMFYRQAIAQWHQWVGSEVFQSQE